MWKSFFYVLWEKEREKAEDKYVWRVDGIHFDFSYFQFFYKWREFTPSSYLLQNGFLAVIELQILS